MNIQVTQDHITTAEGYLNNTHGLFLDKFLDPVTLAVKESLKATRCITHHYNVEVDGKMYGLPDEVREFYSNWVSRLPVKPFNFNLEPI